MNDQTASTAPKPFIFVLMPFREEFNDIYKFGIKGAAEDVGAYSERVDEQDYTESMLERIYNQINKADVIVADMTGQNPNVFYEVGYAHALNKIVLLLTQNSNDIPFDLKHRPHIVYGGQIEQLRTKLAQKLKWAINEAKTRSTLGSVQAFAVSIQDTYIPEASTLEGAPIIELFAPKNDLKHLEVPLLVQNLSSETTFGVSHIYLFTSNDSSIAPIRFRRFEDRRPHPSLLKPVEKGAALPLNKNNLLPVRYRLDMGLPQIPPGAVEELPIYLRFIIRDEAALNSVLNEQRTNAPQKEESLALRIHTRDSVQDFPFKVKVTVLMTTPAQ